MASQKSKVTAGITAMKWCLAENNERKRLVPSCPWGLQRKRQFLVPTAMPVRYIINLQWRAWQTGSLHHRDAFSGEL